jgi:hypothetical protein
MKFRISRRALTVSLSGILLLTVLLVLFAFARTWNKTDLEFRFHINEKLVRESTFGESPTFAIWLEDPVTGQTRTVFVTNRAGLGDWEGKKDVPVALPKWFEVNAIEKSVEKTINDNVPEKLTITGATPKPGYFSTRVRVAPGSGWICWIEVNLAGDFNETYKEYDEVAKTSDEYKTGQPALIYRAQVNALQGNAVIPEIAGMCIIGDDSKVVIREPAGITTATAIFDELTISVVKPKPRIIEW